MSNTLPINNGDTGREVADKIFNSHQANANGIIYLEGKLNETGGALNDLSSEVGNIKNDVDSIPKQDEVSQSDYNNITPELNKVYVIVE